MLWFWFLTFRSGLPVRRNNGVGLGVKMAFGPCWRRCSNAWGRTRWGICQGSKWICLCRSYDIPILLSVCHVGRSYVITLQWQLYSRLIQAASMLLACLWGPVGHGTWPASTVTWSNPTTWVLMDFVWICWKFLCTCGNLKTWMFQQKFPIAGPAIYCHVYVNQWVVADQCWVSTYSNPATGQYFAGVAPVSGVCAWPFGSWPRKGTRLVEIMPTQTYSIHFETRTGIS